MQNIRNIYLVGPMGVGKTTIGKQLSKRLQKDFFDSDTEIEKRTGVSIDVIFDIEGEDGFRKRETNMLRELTARSDIVLATGGGAVLSEENRELLMTNGFIIFLNASIESLLSRTERDKRRPLLQTEDKSTRIEELLKARIPIYKNIADMTITTDERPIKKVVHEIVQEMNIS